jgi:hypothetical protein
MVLGSHITTTAHLRRIMVLFFIRPFRQLRDGNVTATPGEYQPADYQAPAIRVKNID